MRNTVTHKFSALLLLMSMILQCSPRVAMGYDFLGGIKDFATSQVENSNKIIDSYYTKGKQSVNLGVKKIEKNVLAGFSLFETKTGINENNWLYRQNKNDILRRTGNVLGTVKGSADIVLDLYSLVAKAPTLPERITKFAFDYKANPQMYQNKVTSGLQTAGSAALTVARNPLLLLGGAYQYGKDTYTEAKKNPLSFGKLEGQVAVGAGSFLIGGAQIKALTTANKAEKVAKAGTVSQKAGLLSSLTTGWRNFAAGETASLSLGNLFNKGTSAINKGRSTITALKNNLNNNIESFLPKKVPLIGYINKNAKKEALFKETLQKEKAVLMPVLEAEETLMAQKSSKDFWLRAPEELAGKVAKAALLDLSKFEVKIRPLNWSNRLAVPALKSIDPNSKGNPLGYIVTVDPFKGKTKVIVNPDTLILGAKSAKQESEIDYLVYMLGYMRTKYFDGINNITEKEKLKALEAGVNHLNIFNARIDALDLLSKGKTKDAEKLIKSERSIFEQIPSYKRILEVIDD